jgi:hypothetical protein
VRPANATSIPITGSYELIQKTNLGSQTKITVRFHLTNQGLNPLYLQELLLSDFGHPPSGQLLTPSITLPPGTAEETSQEFVIPRLEFDQWQKGVPPRVVLQLKTTTGTNITQTIRLVRVPAGKGK